MVDTLTAVSINPLSSEYLKDLENARTKVYSRKDYFQNILVFPSLEDFIQRYKLLLGFKGRFDITIDGVCFKIFSHFLDKPS